MALLHLSLEFEDAQLNAEDRLTIGMYEELVDRRRNRGRASPDEECWLQGLRQEINAIRERVGGVVPN